MLPSRLCELYLTSDMDNHISAYHSNVNSRNRQNMPQNTEEVSWTFGVFSLLNGQELHIPLAQQVNRNGNTFQESLSKILNLEIFFENYTNCH